ncbi:Uncharacterised protein [Legionella pneumophila]|nr:Uncharacterised protein [Legionella pneumophila]CZH29313.1 Uncharacterised protein [Legionella pneumophila]CZH41031.1 Uncharacterised protein [Legionella pneumophila]CZH63968.1 Uncharacterised protein [Legionella pneumophila]CZH65441.1 Uncharacterised protein [Legionella pneumophila]
MQRGKKWREVAGYGLESGFAARTTDSLHHDVIRHEPNGLKARQYETQGGFGGLCVRNDIADGFRCLTKYPWQK